MGIGVPVPAMIRSSWRNPSTNRLMSPKKPQIIAIGGGSFSVEPDNPRIERYVLAQTRKRSPRVCFIGTATGDADTYVAKFYAAFAKLGCRPTHIPLFARTPDLRKVLLSQDVIYVGGGNTKSMLAVWRNGGFPRSCARPGVAGSSSPA
jgi:dipeptidase E